MNSVVVVGASFAGLAAALELRKLLSSDVTVRVVSASDKFIFAPSLIWVMQGWREADDLLFPIQPILSDAGIDFIHAKLESIKRDERTISIDTGETIPYNRLLLATGGEWDWQQIPGSLPRPDGYTTSILSMADAMAAREHWNAFLEDPGPIVVGVALGGSLFGAAYELVMNLDMALRHAKVRDQSSITLVTPEPHLGHFGLEGIGESRKVLETAFEHRDILWATEKQIREVQPDALVTSPLQHFPSKLTMLIPPYRGIKPLRDIPNLVNERGLIPVDDHQRSLAYPDIFAAGTATQIEHESAGLLPLGQFFPGTVSAEMGRIAATNIAADFGVGTPRVRTDETLKAFYVLDSGGEGLLMSLGAQPWLNLQMRVPGPWSHWAKSMVERYQMWQVQIGKY